MHILHVQARMNRLATEFQDLIKTIDQYKFENSEVEVNNLYDLLDKDYPFDDTLEEILKKVIAWNKEFQINSNNGGK